VPENRSPSTLSRHAVSLSEFLREELEDMARAMTWPEWTAELRPARLSRGSPGQSSCARRATSASASSRSASDGVTTVVDASVLVELLVGGHVPAANIERRLGPETRRTTLDIADLEVISAVRRGVHRGRLGAAQADAAVAALSRLAVRRLRASPLRERVWQLPATHTPYDAAYVALAERLRAPLATTDRRLARSRGHEAEIIDL
jgi:predicted nucleic acid-binding protein